MKYKIVAHTDIGIRKGTNQDAVLVKIAKTEVGEIVLGAVCDGMGGLAKGEVASSEVIRMISGWFDNIFPQLLQRGLRMETLQKSWETLVFYANGQILSYGRKNCCKMGTTMTVLLIAEGNYYLCNVGDSRIYCLHKTITLLTKDQTLVQREIDSGRLNAVEADTDERRNILLQCIGASKNVRPDYYTGTVHSGSLFLICSDGFRRKVSQEELYQSLAPRKMKKERFMEKGLFYLTELNKSRLETDNISAALIRVD